MQYIVYAIPVFFVMIALEVIVGWVSGKRLYRINDSVNDLSMGIVSTIGGAFTGALSFAAYMFVWDQFRLLDFGAEHLGAWQFPIWVWVLAFVCKDFVYYWAHRMSHEMNLGWATHIAHHQSEEYNLSVALRQGVFQPFFFWIFNMPLALVGFPPVVYIVVAQLVTLYQFWIHTRAIGKLGPLEWVLNTPSHHRVHHGRDDKYIDKNHAGTFIIWDRMFGTFQEEEEEPHYGTVTPLRSWNPLWGQVHYLVKLGRQTWAAPRWRDKVQVWFREPAFVPEGLEGMDAELARREDEGKYDARAPFGLTVYIVVHFALILGLATGFLTVADQLPLLQKVVGAVLVFATVGCLGGMFEGRLWAFWGEIARTTGLVATILVMGSTVFALPPLESWAWPAGVMVVAAVSLYWFTRYRALFRHDAEGLAVADVGSHGGNQMKTA